jgi:hypothetical protein
MAVAIKTSSMVRHQSNRDCNAPRPLRRIWTCSALTFAQLVDTHKRYLEKTGKNPGEAEQALLSFLEWDEPDDDRFANAVRIVLASANFSKELTTSVLWLNEQGVDIRCVRLKPYRDTDGTVILDVQQLIPLPEAAEYQTQIKAKERAGKACSVMLISSPLASFASNCSARTAAALNRRTSCRRASLIRSAPPWSITIALWMS